MADSFPGAATNSGRGSSEDGRNNFLNSAQPEICHLDTFEYTAGRTVASFQLCILLALHAQHDGVQAAADAQQG